MADRTFASLIPRVNPSVPGCPYPTIIQYVRDAAVRACERTLAWRWAHPKIILTPGVPEYEYGKPAGTDVHAVFLATVNDYPLEILTLDRATQLYPAWVDYFSGVDPATLWGQNGLNTDPLNTLPLNGGAPAVLPPAALEKCSEPRSLTQVSPARFVLLPAPDDTKEYAVRIICALKPARGASAMDQVVFDDLEETIFHGALQHLLMLPGAWSNLEKSAYHAKQFTYQCAERRARANLGNQRGTLRARMARFA